MQRAAHAAWTRVSQLITVSTAASIGSLPFTATYFHLLTLSSVAANLIIVPMAFVILAEGLLSIISAIFSSTLAAIFNNANWCIAHATLWAVHLLAQIPASHFAVELPRFGPAPDCEINVLDLGAGGAIHLRSQGRDWLIDCGNTYAYQGIVRPYLRTRGVDRLDGLILTHGNTNFIGAATAAETDLTPRLTGESPLTDRSRTRRDFHKWSGEHGSAIGQYKRGDVLAVSPGVKMRVLYPPPELNARTADDKALVLRLECDGFSVLFMSASGSITERWLLENDPDLRCDILIKNQRTTDTSGTPEFIDAVRPRVVVCSAAAFPASQQIDETWAADIAARGIILFRQDQAGAVTLELNKQRFAVKGFLNGQTFLSNSR